MLHSIGGMLTDPELAWVVYNRPMWRATSGGGRPYSSYLWALTWQSTPPIPEDKTVSPIPTGTTVLPDYGGVAMRVPDAGNYCWFHFGRELVHGHRNKLSINAYAKGEWFVRNIAGGYGDDFKDFLETVASATTIMVDGSNPDWDTGELLYQASLPGIELVAGREVGAGKDVEHERAVALAESGLLIVVDRCAAEAEHTYDWLYHSGLTKLSLATEGLLPPPERLGESVHYRSLVPYQSFPAPDGAKPLGAHLTRKDGSGLKISLLPAGELHAFKALKKYDGLLWRRQGKTVGFAAALWPYAKDEQGDVTIVSLPVSDMAGKPVSLDQAQAVRVTTRDKIYTMVVNYSATPVVADGLTGTERVTVRVTANGAQ